MVTAELARAARRLSAFVEASTVAAERAEARCALDATGSTLGLLPIMHRAPAVDVDTRRTLDDLAALDAAARALVDPERRAAAVACAAWLATLLRPAVLSAAGWRRSTTNLDAWVDPHAPEDLHDEASAWRRLARDEAA